MNVIKLSVGACDYNRAKELSVSILGVEVYVSRTRGGVWSLGAYVEWLGWSKDFTFWKKK